MFLQPRVFVPYLKERDVEEGEGRGGPAKKVKEILVDKHAMEISLD